jgi:hypothetical protein
MVLHTTIRVLARHSLENLEFSGYIIRLVLKFCLNEEPIKCSEKICIWFIIAT